ncbi:hypothetical protein FHW12_000357 [Dokdonella fugitiva]|uniref:Uncharacterized protein n=1 Tax=Dokdonella fugitiva TaxID=328517 RepID=A0A839EUS5_9GAMM|nr:hypothetical protein [Dokdonella fugitiva]MBA8886166.1 hypothetical protein [Dokdonella fugitiva]
MGRAVLIATITTNPQSADALTLRPSFPTQPVAGVAATNCAIVASGGTGGYVYALVNHPPAWITVDSTTGALTFTAPDTGKYTIDAEVQDSSSTVAYLQFSIEATSPVVFTGGTPPIGEIGIAYEFALTASGATGTMSWAHSAGTLPAGLSIAGSDVTGTPTAPYGISYATITGTDSGTGATCVVQLAFDIRDVLDDTPPSDPVEIFVNTPVSIDLSTYWSAGVPPYRVVPAGTFPTGLQLVRNRLGFGWLITGTTPASFSGDDTDWSMGVEVYDSLGAHVTVAWLLIARENRNIGFAQLNGVDVGASGAVPRYDFSGLCVGSVTRAFDGSKFTIDFTPQLAACTVMGNATGSTAAATAIQATTNNRVLARTSGGVLAWTQITMPMISASGTAGSTNFLRGDGSWASVTMGTISATGTPSSATFLRGDGSWSTPTISLNGNAGSSFTLNGSSQITVAFFSGTFTFSHATSGVSAATYDNLTFNGTGHCTAAAVQYSTEISIAVTNGSSLTNTAFSSAAAGTDVVRLTGSGGGTANIHGFINGASNARKVMLLNQSNTTVTIVNNSGTETTAANRFALDANFVVPAERFALLWKDGTIGRWRVQVG